MRLTQTRIFVIPVSVPWKSFLDIGGRHFSDISCWCCCWIKIPPVLSWGSFIPIQVKPLQGLSPLDRRSRSWPASALNRPRESWCSRRKNGEETGLLEVPQFKSLYQPSTPIPSISQLLSSFEETGMTSFGWMSSGRKIRNRGGKTNLIFKACSELEL